MASNKTILGVDHKSYDKGVGNYKKLILAQEKKGKKIVHK